ncbi:MAG TPA: glycosyltransferase [Longimicrobium sp.]|nr:glycosyltransferase [Longimicrobium sp.]
MRISACLITRDEARFLPGCLRSLRDAADEIVVVDTGSRDDTVSIARDFGCTVLHHPWNDDYAAARNVGLHAAGGDWIVVIDADERLMGGGEMRALAAEAGPETGGFLIEREDVVRHPATGRTERYPIGMVRLFRRDPRIRYVGRVHERPGDTIRAAGYEIRSTHRLRLTHLVSARPDEELAAKQRRYLALLDAEIAARPGDPWPRYYRAKTVWYLGGHAQADAELAALAADPRHPGPQRASAHAMRAALAVHSGRPAEALAHVEASLAAFAFQSLAHFLRGEALLALGRFDEAAEAYGRVRESMDPRVVTEWIPGDLYLPAETRAYKLGSCRLAAGDAPAALAHFRHGMAANPADAACWFGAAHVALAGGDPVLGGRLLDEASARDPGWRTPRALRARLAAGEDAGTVDPADLASPAPV